MRYQYLVIFILTILIFATSCTSIKESLGGNYFAKWGTDGFYYIHLDDSDSTFEYESNALHKGKYNGFWKISKDSIYLHFPKSNNPIHIITAHNLHNQVWRLKINKRSLYFPYLKIKYRKINEQRIIKWRNNSGKRHCACSAEGTLLKRTREAKIGSSSSFRDYSGSRIFESGVLQYSYFPGGYFDSAGAAHYCHTDYQGSIIAITDSLGTVVQTVGYYPYGEPWREPSGQPMLFAGKERTPLADYLFGPRRHIPALGLWDAPDIFAGKYTNISPFAYCAGNPIHYTDPTGMIINMGLLNSVNQDFVNAIINDLNDQTGLTFMLDENSNLQYAKDADGKAIISTFIGKDGNIECCGSETARELVMGAVNNTEIIEVSYSKKVGTNELENKIGLNPSEINKMINGAVNVDGNTLGFGMTFMHELNHTAACGSLKDDKRIFGSGEVVDKMNVIRSELNAKGFNYGQRMNYMGIQTSEGIIVPFNKSALDALKHGLPMSSKHMYIKY